MTNYEKIMQDMTPERLAEVNVKLVTVNNTNLFYMTSSGQLFNTNEYQKAVQYEYNWLTYDDKAAEVPMSDCEAGEPDCNCEECACEPDSCDEARK